MKKTMINRALIALIFAFTTISSHAIGLLGASAWAGYGIGIDSAYSGICDSATDAGEYCTSGGFSLGGDLWLLELDKSFQLGLGIAYLPILNAGYSDTTLDPGSITSVSRQVKVRYIPFMAQLRFDIDALPIYLGAMAGYSFGSGSFTSRSTINNIPITGGFAGSIGGAFTLGGFAGYEYKVTPLIAIDAGARMYLVLAPSIIVQFVPFVGATFTF